MTDPAERRSLVPRGTFDPSQPARDTEPDPVDAPLYSYIDELRTRVESLSDVDDALMVPPDAAPPRAWVAGDIEAALHAAAETVPRSPSSPDAPAAAVVEAPMLDSMVPPAELAPRHVRRPPRELVDDFPVELEEQRGPTLRARDRGRKSGRFASPAGLLASRAEGSIAAAVIGLVEAERAATLPPLTARVELPVEHAESPAASDALPASLARSEPAVSATESHEPAPAPTTTVMSHSADEVVDARQHATPSALATAARVIVLFAAASIAGGTAVYFLLHG